MRGRIAAACAAVLVGLAPPGALACAPWLGEAWVSAPSSAARAARRPVSAVPALHDGAAVAPPAFAAVPGEPARALAVDLAPAIWRSPSGPAPSQAPPAV